MPELFFENVHTKTRFKILEFDNEAQTVKLIGKHQKEFVEPYTKERFVKMGYTLVEGEPVAPPPPA